ncbi:MAG: 4Fe-4S binding protein [Phycisphaerales bacterium]|jgi:anaerobic sulfite reductase subunit C|nr:4Fe-4S binding protein [Phycisphaerales bacterium]MBT7170386.1 4Fe-4S binding protein [Phycisphaerales bacterium]
MKPHIKTTPTDRQRKLMGYIPMREPGVYSIRLHCIGGALTAENLVALSQIVTKYGTSEVHVTTRQSMELSNIPAKHLEAMHRDLTAAGLSPRGSGPWLRSIISCPGTRCRNGLIETTPLAKALYEAAGERKLPHKFKIGITGCPNDCAGATGNDFGVMGILRKTLHEDQCMHCEACVRFCPVKALSLDGNNCVKLDEQACVDCGKCISACPVNAWESAGEAYRITLGAKGGRIPLTGHVYPYPLDSEEQVIALLTATLDWYSRHGQSRERFGATLNRIGWELFLADTPRPVSPDNHLPPKGH